MEAIYYYDSTVIIYAHRGFIILPNLVTLMYKSNVILTTVANRCTSIFHGRPVRGLSFREQARRPFEQILRFAICNNFFEVCRLANGPKKRENAICES